MGKFITPPHERTSSPKYSGHTNTSVNMNIVLTVEKSREAYYPDNEGIPTIRFWFGAENYHVWYFDKGEEISRDKNYMKVLAND